MNTPNYTATELEQKKLELILQQLVQAEAVSIEAAEMIKKAEKMAEDAEANVLSARVGLSNYLDIRMNTHWGFHIAVPHIIFYINADGAPYVQQEPDNHITRGGMIFLEYLAREKHPDVLELDKANKLDFALNSWAMTLQRGLIVREITANDGRLEDTVPMTVPAFYRRETGEYEMFIPRGLDTESGETPSFDIFLCPNWGLLKVAAKAALLRENVKGLRKIKLQPGEAVKRFPSSG